MGLLRAQLQRYLDQHDVQPKLNALLNRLVYQTPDKPYAWMADELEAAALAGPTWPTPAVAAADPATAAMQRQWDVAMSFQAQGGGAAPAASAASAAPTAPATPWCWHLRHRLIHVFLYHRP